MQGFSVEFDQLDEIGEDEAGRLIAELKTADADAHVTETAEPQGFVVASTIILAILVATASVSALSVVAAFIYRVFRCGVILDLRGVTPKVHKNAEMPKGSLLVIHADGREEYHEGIADDQIGKLMEATVKAAMAAAKPKPA